MNRVLVVFSDGLLSELDSARGLVSRSAWIRQAVEDKLMKEAVAPLVPSIERRPLSDEEWAGFQEGAGLQPVQRNEPWVRPPVMAEALVPLDFDEAEDFKAEPKPKARRKVKPPKEYDFAKDRPEGCVCTYDMLGRIWNSACKVHDSASDKRTQNYVASVFPARCNRGACTGIIKPNGRCIRCNQEPLKESK